MPRRALLKAQRLRWLVVARLESAGLGSVQIADCTSYSPKTIQKTLDLPAYQEWRNARLSNGISAIDHIISNDAQEMKTALRELVPAAIHRLGVALSSQEESIALRAAAEILDRDERFNKQAQMSVSHSFSIPEVDLERARAIARELRPIEQPLLSATLSSDTSEVIDITKE